VKEIEIAVQLESEMRKRGSEGTPFGTTVASSYRGELPHGRASGKVINNGELVSKGLNRFIQKDRKKAFMC
jgi:Xaa-Pro dipeptidase